VLGEGMSGSNARTMWSVPVWDLPTRLFHWSLAALVVASWVTGELGWMIPHFIGGYAILCLLLFRLIWGFVGSRSARFVDFVKGPRAVFDHLAHLRQSSEAAPPVLRHNPLGGWMVVFLLTILLVQATSGLFTTDDILTEGPLVGLASGTTVRLLSSVHRFTSGVIPWLIGLHVAAIAVYLILRRENLVRPMITGVKAVPAGSSVSLVRPVGLWRAVLALAISIVTLAAIVQGGLISSSRPGGGNAPGRARWDQSWR
jgi:cytochrome b